MSSKISCKQAVDYISKKEEGKLSASQRVALYRHLSECSLCQTFSVQNKIIGKAMTLQDDSELNATEKEAIVKAVLKKKQ